MEKELKNLNDVSDIIRRNYPEVNLLEKDIFLAQDAFMKQRNDEYNEINARLAPIRNMMYSGLPQLNLREFKDDIRRISSRSRYLRERLAELSKKTIT